MDEGGIKERGEERKHSLLDILYTFGLEILEVGLCLVDDVVVCMVCTYIVHITIHTFKAAPDIQCRLKDLPLP